MGYIDELDVPRLYRGVVEEFRDGDLSSFVGSYCGYPVFSGSQEVIHPTTGEVVGYSNDIQIGCKRSVSLLTLYDNIVSTVYDPGDTTIDELLERGYVFLEKERRRSIPLDMGRVGIKTAAFSGAVGGLLEWFDFSSTVSVTGATAAAAIGGLSSVYRRHRDKERLRRHLKWLSRVFLDMEKTTFSVNLLAPDSLIDSDTQTGSADNRQASNVYLVGGVPVDQQQRFNLFWDQADEILGEYGFTEWQGYRTVGMPELIRRILEDSHNNSDFYDDDKEKVGSAIKRFGRCRSVAIKDIEELQAGFKAKESCKEHGIKGRAHALSNRSGTRRIKQADRRYMEAFCDLVASIEDTTFKVKKRSTHDLLVSIYGGKSWYQEYFWDELSRVLTIHGVDSCDDSVAEPARFIVDLPDMIPAYSKKLPARYVVRRLYKDFYRLYSERYAGMLLPKDFIDVDQHSEYGILSRLR